jgi:glutamyl-tRNA synthetase
VVVRIAPSPTGDPHVGTAYVALFNRALRRRRGGRFILRIEDTDRKRSTVESEARIFEALAWLGLAYDEGPDIGGPCAPYRQSERSAVYREHAEKLLASGHAYRCFCTEDRIAAARLEQKARGLSTGYDGLCRDLSPDEVRRNLDAGLPCVIRLKVPREGDTSFTDLARGLIVFQNAQLDDQVLLKSDGFPTYHLANVVDDHLMGVSHVIRAEEWISSTPKHVLLYRAFAWEPPAFLHMPLLRNRDHSKISKRKNPVSLVWYRDCGILPETLLNFLATMGYSIPPASAPIPEEPEVFSFEDLVRDLDLSRIKTSGPVFDLQKLDHFNGVYVRRMAPDALADRLLDFLRYLGRERERLAALEAEPPSGEGEMPERERSRRELTKAALALAARPPAREVIVRTLPLVQERLKGLLDYADLTGFLWEDGELQFDTGLLLDKKTTPTSTAAAFEAWAAQARREGEWTPPALDAWTRPFCEKIGWKPKVLFMALRVAVTGRKVSPPLFESMEILGRDRTLARVISAAARLRALHE